MQEIYTFDLTKSKRNACFWERGGGYTNSGDVELIANKEGDPKKPIYIRTGGQLACAKHALFIVNDYDWIIKVNRSRDDYTIRLYQIGSFMQIDEQKEIAQRNIINEYVWAEGEWVSLHDTDTMSQDIALLERAVEAAKAKSHSYHCRRMYYGIN